MTASFPFFFPSVVFWLVSLSFADVLINGWADGNFGGRVVENSNLLGALVVFRDNGTGLIVVCCIRNNIMSLNSISYFAKYNYFNASYRFTQT